MALDDAIGKARQERDRQEEQARLKEKWEAEAKQRVRKLGAEAVARLAPYANRESLHLFRLVRGPQNRSAYQRAGTWWCWQIKDMESGSVIHPKVMLLVVDPDRTTGYFAAVSLEQPRTDQGQYLTTLPLEPVGPVHYSKQHPMAFFGSEWVGYLEQDVADAIVRYEREG
ncbi:hypothetical protein ACFWBR_41385 [Streptomyces sp. NPDC060006]|uniref:hypothetical protein n=1 Tax=unclassified Streptomyces TaxID=2593676 RepID=UPI003676C037